MSRNASIFVCQQCSYESPRWFGKCPECGSWNTAVETFISKASSKHKTPRTINLRGGQNSKPIRLADVEKSSTKRILTKISELDRVLGGGLVAGQVTLIA